MSVPGVHEQPELKHSVNVMASSIPGMAHHVGLTQASVMGQRPAWHGRQQEQQQPQQQPGQSKKAHERFYGVVKRTTQKAIAREPQNAQF